MAGLLVLPTSPAGKNRTVSVWVADMLVLVLSPGPTVAAPGPPILNVDGLLLLLLLPWYVCGTNETRRLRSQGHRCFCYFVVRATTMYCCSVEYRTIWYLCMMYDRYHSRISRRGIQTKTEAPPTKRGALGIPSLRNSGSQKK